jgi:hypothetical protein
MFTLVIFKMLVIMLVNDYLDCSIGLFNFELTSIIRWTYGQTFKKIDHLCCFFTWRNEMIFFLPIMFTLKL